VPNCDWHQPSTKTKQKIRIIVTSSVDAEAKKAFIIDYYFSTMKISPSLCFVIILPALTQAFSPKHQADTSWKNVSHRPLTFWCASAFWSVLAPVAFAVSGGGLDFAGIDISGQDFSKGNYKGKDFTQGALAKKQIDFFHLRFP
jgi:hypothetical protein